jgi:peroxiredoxin
MGRVTQKLLFGIFTVCVFFSWLHAETTDVGKKISGIIKKLKEISGAELHYKCSMKYPTIPQIYTMDIHCIYAFTKSNSEKIECIMTIDTNTVYIYNSQRIYKVDKKKKEVYELDSNFSSPKVTWLLFYPLFDASRYLLLFQNDSLEFYSCDTVINDRKLFYLRTPRSSSGISDSLNKSITEFYYDMDDSMPVFYKQVSYWLGTQIVDQSLLDKKIYATDFPIDSLLKKTLNFYEETFTVKEFDPMALLKSRKKPLPIGDSAPDFHLQSMNGDTISLNKLNNKVIILDFWYVGCYPCQLSLPFLSRLNERYKKEGLLVLGIDLFDQRENIYPTITKIGIQYQILLGKNTSVKKDYHVYPTPTLFILDANKKILYQQQGYSKELEGRIEEVVKGELVK